MFFFGTSYLSLPLTISHQTAECTCKIKQPQQYLYLSSLFARSLHSIQFKPDKLILVHTIVSMPPTILSGDLERCIMSQYQMDASMGHGGNSWEI